MSVRESMGYRSPIRKLLRFFQRSRDRWKEKCKAAKRENKSLKTRLAKMKESRDRWKAEARQLRERQEATTAPPQQPQQSGSSGRQQQPSQENEPEDEPSRQNEPAEGERALAELHAGDLDASVPRQQYSLGVIAGSLALVVQAATPLQRVSAVLEISWSWCDVSAQAASYYAVRLWFLRVGLYQLQRPKEQADDWMWIIDHTVVLGPWKCLIIVGIRQSTWDPENRVLGHGDVELIDVVPVRESNGDIVYRQLKAAVAKTGVPRAIVSDSGRIFTVESTVSAGPTGRRSGCTTLSTRWRRCSNTACRAIARGRSSSITHTVASSRSRSPNWLA